MASAPLHSLTAATSANTTDELYLVQSPFGVGDDRRITFDNAQKSITTLASNATLPGNPTTTTQSPGDDSTRIATTAFVAAAVNIPSGTPNNPVAASGTITVDDYTQALAASAATGAITIVDFDKLNEASATGTATVLDYTNLSGAIVSVAGHDLTEGSDWTAATSNDATATSLASAIDALSEVTASATGAVVTIVAATPGTAGNSITLSTDADDSGYTTTLTGVGTDAWAVLFDFGDYTSPGTNSTLRESQAGQACFLLDTNGTVSGTVSMGILNPGPSNYDTLMASFLPFTAENIAFDDSGSGVAFGNDATWNHVVTGTHPLMLFGVRVDGTATAPDVTYNGVAATQIASASSSWASGVHLYIYALINPDTGSHTAEASCSGASRVTGLSVSYTGAKQSGVPDQVTTDSGPSAAAVDLSGANLEDGLDFAVLTVGDGTYEAGTDFDAETDNDTTASNLADAITSALPTNLDTAIATSAVVDLTSDPGSAGNLALTTSNVDGATVSGANMTGGVDEGADFGNKITIDGQDLIFGTEISVTAASNDDLASNIQDAIQASAAATDVDSAQDTDEVDLTAVVAGAAGNSIDLTTDATSTVSVTGAGTLTGGVDGTPGDDGEQFQDSDYHYISTGASTTTVGNWKRDALESF